jgi:predicted NAD/FAD-dependent oxidoreductase
MTVIVVGAGIAGLACARELTTAGVAVRVLERGRVVGGRLASRTLGGRRADIGAAYFTVDDPGFAGLVATWQAAGLARPWTDTLTVYDDPPSVGTGSPRRTSGPVRWAAPGGLRSLAEAMADGLDVTLRQPVTAIGRSADGSGPTVDGERVDAVVLAMPGPQALRILDPALSASLAAARAQSWSPVLAAVLTYGTRSWADFAGAFVNGHPVLATVVDDGDRRGDLAPVLVAHSTPDFAASRLADPAAAGPELEAATRELLGLPGPATDVHVHRWTYAQPHAAPGGAAPFHGADGVLLAGDAFGKPRVQTAWLSGRAAAGSLVRPPG